MVRAAAPTSLPAARLLSRSRRRRWRPRSDSRTRCVQSSFAVLLVACHLPSASLARAISSRWALRHGGIFEVQPVQRIDDRRGDDDAGEPLVDRRERRTRAPTVSRSGGSCPRMPPGNPSSGRAPADRRPRTSSSSPGLSSRSRKRLPCSFRRRGGRTSAPGCRFSRGSPRNCRCRGRAPSRGPSPRAARAGPSGAPAARGAPGRRRFPHSRSG